MAHQRFPHNTTALCFRGRKRHMRIGNNSLSLRVKCLLFCVAAILSVALTGAPSLYESPVSAPFSAAQGTSEHLSPLVLESRSEWVSMPRTTQRQEKERMERLPHTARCFAPQAIPLYATALLCILRLLQYISAFLSVKRSIYMSTRIGGHSPPSLLSIF